MARIQSLIGSLQDAQGLIAWISSASSKSHLYLARRPGSREYPDLFKNNPGEFQTNAV
jgi:hypothetical protein